MNRTRLAVVAVFGLGLALGVGCSIKEPNGGECLKNADCESDRCVQYVCTDPNALHAVSTTDSGTPAETGADASDSGTPADTAMPMDTAGETTTDAGSD